MSTPFLYFRVIGPGSVSLISHFLDWNDLRAVSTTNHGHFVLLQQSRVSKRKTRDDNPGENKCPAMNADFGDEQARLQYYTQVESFEYQFLYGRILNETDDAVTAHLLRE